MHSIRLTATLAGLLVATASAGAQTSPSATSTSAATHTRVATTTKTTRINVPVQRTAKSLDCSKQADAKNVHGKARKSFMSSCKKA